MMNEAKKKKNDDVCMAMPEQPPAIRRRNFLEVPAGYTMEMARRRPRGVFSAENLRVWSGVRWGWIFPVLSNRSPRET